jgi:hypothetical protein
MMSTNHTAVSLCLTDIAVIRRTTETRNKKIYVERFLSFKSNSSSVYRRGSSAGSGGVYFISLLSLSELADFFASVCNKALHASQPATPGGERSQMLSRMRNTLCMRNLFLRCWEKEVVVCCSAVVHSWCIHLPSPQVNSAGGQLKNGPWSPLFYVEISFESPIKFSFLVMS